MSPPTPFLRLPAYLAASDMLCGLAWHDGLGWYVGEDEADVPVVVEHKGT